ncbi:TonB-dependent receptor [Teredinibacter turnerae T7901]|uniref:TonB-dependent receptor n=1 Tax=Teredinibacter turnerae (strain ATCC 39867 / T7901) TaxID=377629 RepID=C5BK74_TERTT|nr:TonB-dependent receptor [Teredinibacter turnerae]ACR14614.1 TonB-dependent receptor [Teredinibacter turnerae T7901]
MNKNPRYAHLVQHSLPGFRRSLLAAAVIACTSQALAQDVETTEDDINLEEVMVTGQRQALETAIDLKRESDTIGDSLVLDEAGKVPSTSLLEILERAPGVTMNRIRAGSDGSPDGFAFEGSNVQVRGLNKTKTLVNGREVFSANGGSGLSWADVGPELLRSVSVLKSSRADLIEGGVSGTVNLETYMPFDFDGFKVNAAASLDYGDFAEEVTPALSGLVSNRYDTSIGEIGVLLNLAYSKISSNDSNIIIPPYFATEYEGERVYAPGGIRHTQDQFERERKGYYAALQWRPNDRLELFHTTFISERDSDRYSQIITVEPAAPVGVLPGAEFDDDGIFVKGTISSTDLASGLDASANSSFSPSSSKTADYSTGFEYRGDGWDLSGSYQYVKADSSLGKYSLGSTIGAKVPNIQMDMSRDRPLAIAGDAISTQQEAALMSRINWLNDENEGEAHAIQLDADFEIGDGFFKKIATGVRAADREESDNFVGTWWSATGRGWNGVPRASVDTAPEGDFYLEEFSDFFKGDEPALGGAWVGSTQVNSQAQFDHVYDTYLACGPDLHYQCANDPNATTYLYTQNGVTRDPNFDQLPQIYTTNHKTQSAYVMAGFANDSENFFANISGNIGVRWVNYDIESEGNFNFNSGGRYYASLADAQASIEAMGGIDNVKQWKEDNNGVDEPLSYNTVSYEKVRTGSLQKDYLLPSFNIKFESDKNLILRYAFTETLTAPRYPDIRAQGVVASQTTANPINTELDAAYPDDDISIPDIFAGYTNTTGNPFLEPELSYNHDISLEWYPRKASSMYLALFHKTIENYITFNNFSAPASTFFNEEDYPQSEPAGGGQSVLIDGPVTSRSNLNADGDTIVKGFEFGGRTYFDTLPGIWSSFGVEANVTFIDNEAPDSFAQDINGDQLSVPVIGLSEWAYSTTLLYDRDKLSARLSWNWRDRYLTTTNDSGTTNVYTDPFSGDEIQYGLPVYAASSGRLDASVSYKFTDTMNVKLNLQNLTDTDQRTEMEILDGKFVDRAVFVADRRISLHFGFNF